MSISHIINKLLENPIRYHRFVHKDGRGLMNMSSVDLSKLTEDEEMDITEMLTYGLQQPPRHLPHKTVFAFTDQGLKENQELIDLLTKASKTGVRRLTLDPREYEVVWESRDGQVGLLPQGLRL